MAIAKPKPEDCDPYSDRRVYPRVSVALPAFLQVDGTRHVVQLLDVSAGGARLNCPFLLSTGALVILDCGTVGREAVVRWQNGEQLGLSFSRELDARDVTALIDRSTALADRIKTRE